MAFIIFLIILFLVWLIFGNQIRQWFARFLANRTEDYIRKATGMPPRPGSRQARRQQQTTNRARGQRTQNNTSGYYDSRSSSGRNTSRGRRNYYSRNDEPLIPKEYAEDVEFVETINYSQTTIGVSETLGRKTVYHESQVSDVEWEDIRPKKKR